jgi:hypothetical protein
MFKVGDIVQYTGFSEIIGVNPNQGTNQTLTLETLPGEVIHSTLGKTYSNYAGVYRVISRPKQQYLEILL